MSEPRPTTLFEDAIDVPTWLESDTHLPLAERIDRDRDIGIALTGNDDVTRVRRWWRHVERAANGLPGRRLDYARQWLDLTLLLVGLIGGIGLALAAFRYDGTYPVNVVRLLAVLVAPQLLLLVLNLLLLPGRLPGLKSLQDALAAINPGALAAAMYRQLTKRSESNVFGWASAPSSAARRFAKWQMLFWSQIAAVGFNVGIIATAVALVTFTDLAFGWSTTLDVDARRATRIAAAIAAPWSAIAPSAVPDAALVERSLFFRLEGGGFADSRALTGWWSFTVLAIVTYGLLPRLAFLILAAWRLRAATRALLLEDSRVTALLDRMSAPKVETRGPEHPEPDDAPMPARSSAARPTLAGTANAVIWNQGLAADTAAEFARSRLGLELGVVAEAGGRSLDADRAAIADVAQSRSVVVFTAAWEPPLLEFTDFLENLRGVLEPSASIVIVPVAEGAGSISGSEREIWTRAVRRIGDPRAYLEPADA